MDPRVISLVSLNILSFSSYTIPLFLIPEISQKRGVGQTATGFIFALFSIGQIVVSLYCAKIMLHYGKKKLLFYGFYLLSFAMFMFGCLDLTYNPVIFQFLGFCSRILQGMAGGLIGTIIYSFVPICFPKDVARIIGILEFTIGFSMAFGGQLGLLLNFMFGYQFAFYIISLTVFLLRNFIINPLPDDESVKDSPSVNYSDFLTSYDFVLMLLCAFITIFGQQFMLSTLVLHLQRFTQEEQQYKSIAMAGHSVAQGITMLCLIRFFHHDFNRQSFVQIGLFVYGTSFIFTGCVSYFSIPFQISYSIFGLIMSGVGFGFLFYPIMPEMQHVAQKLNIGDRTKVNDACSAFFVCSLAAGGFIGPAYGGLMCDLVGHELTCFLNFLIFFTLFTLVYQNNRNKTQELDENQIELLDTRP